MVQSNRREPRGCGTREDCCGLRSGWALGGGGGRMSASHARGVSLNLLHGFQLRGAAGVLTLPLGEQRVLAFLALHGRWLQRLFVAGSLWLESSEERANASLRTAL